MHYLHLLLNTHLWPGVTAFVYSGILFSYMVGYLCSCVWEGKKKQKQKHENYLHREKAKKTDCRLTNRTNGVRVAASQHIRTGTAKGKTFSPKLFVRNRISSFAYLFIVLQ